MAFCGNYWCCYSFSVYIWIYPGNILWGGPVYELEIWVLWVCPIVGSIWINPSMGLTSSPFHTYTGPTMKCWLDSMHHRNWCILELAQLFNFWDLNTGQKCSSWTWIVLRLNPKKIKKIIKIEVLFKCKECLQSANSSALCSNTFIKL